MVEPRGLDHEEIEVTLPSWTASVAQKLNALESIPQETLTWVKDKGLP